jgi:hypothetical protein
LAVADSKPDSEKIEIEVVKKINDPQYKLVVELFQEFATEYNK